MIAWKPLLWKDLRLARGYLVAGAAVLVTPLLYLGSLWWRATADAPPDWPMHFQFTGIFAGIGAIMVVSLLAGASFATERTDRSAEFLAYLPLTRGMRLLSKLAIVGGSALLLALCNPLIGVEVLPYEWPQGEGMRGEAIVTLLCSGAAVLGVAWLASTGVSAAAALLLGLLSPFFVTCLYFLGDRAILVTSGIEIDSDHWFPIVYRWACGVLGPIAFALGSWLFVRRGP